MTAVLLDTHVWAWSLTDGKHISRSAMGAIRQADTVVISPISFFEIAQKVRLGEWPEMEPHVRDLPTLLERQGGSLAGFDGRLCIAAGMMAWLHRDPFDRLLAATASRFGLLLISADKVFDGIVPQLW